MEVHFQISDLKTFSCKIKKLGYCTSQHDLVFASLQIWESIFCDRADVGLAVSSNDLILFVAMMSRAEAIAASSCVVVFVAPDPLGVTE